ncbi:SDR family NAD(P)-dependent oxidoreductase [Phyllobacterium lublinensis]|uniref:SDR family NAD(P)-dependent oxidoreductase n=1 Tax=Phyllobacterium lublinensis TaxID=2875708 RepID=UPI001CCB1DAD|nr:SDR family oxidoreductase [Phyllobacterium sp. 2063]MBZ9653142.1 SDR family oxidoreductase [Phyllobacterium sp. 2063]
MNAFKEKTVLITGGGSGIGLAAAKQFAAHGAKVLITGRRKEVLEEISVNNPNIHGHVADAGDPETAHRTIEAVLDRWGRLDILINNAGNGAIQPLVGTSAQSVADIFAVNVTGPVLLTAAAVPHLAETKGAIVNMSSTFGSKAAAGLSLYASSKAAVEHLTRCWALELAPQGIRVNAIAPGPVETEFLRERMKLSDEQIAAVKDQERQSIPLGRRGVPDDVAQWILNVADPRATWITGQVIAVDGGLVTS